MRWRPLLLLLLLYQDVNTQVNYWNTCLLLSYLWTERRCRDAVSEEGRGGEGMARFSLVYFTSLY